MTTAPTNLDVKQTADAMRSALGQAIPGAAVSLRMAAGSERRRPPPARAKGGPSTRRHGNHPETHNEQCT